MIFENWFNHVQSANLHGRGLLRPKWQFQRAFDDCNSDSHAGALWRAVADSACGAVAVAVVSHGVGQGDGCG